MGVEEAGASDIRRASKGCEAPENSNERNPNSLAGSGVISNQPERKEAPWPTLAQETPVRKAEDPLLACDATAPANLPTSSKANDEEAKDTGTEQEEDNTKEKEGATERSESNQAHSAACPPRSNRAERLARKQAQMNQQHGRTTRRGYSAGNTTELASPPGSSRSRLPPNTTPEQSNISSPGITRAALPGDNLVSTAAGLTSRAPRPPAPLVSASNPQGRTSKASRTAPLRVSVATMPASGASSQSLPGAFPGGFITTRRQSSDASVLSNGNFTLYNTSEALYNSRDMILPSSSPFGQSTDNTSGLVEADPVRMSQDFTRGDLEVAELVDGSETEEQKKKKTKSLQLHMSLAGGLALLVILAIVVFFVLRSSDAKEEYNTLPSNAPTAAATQEPLMALLPASTQQIIQTDPHSPQTMAYQWMQYDPKFMDYSDARLLQRFAMVTLYYSTDGPSWNHQGGGTVEWFRPPPPGIPPGGPPGAGGGPPLPKVLNITKEQWLDYDSDECDWFWSSTKTMCPGDNQTVGVIKMVQNNLAGTLPPELGLLSSIQDIMFFINKIRGTLVTEIGALTNLREFMINGNKISGPVPSEIGQLSNTLQKFSILDNGFRGSLPSQLWHLSHLEVLKVARNAFTGALPENFGDYFLKLKEVRISMNLITGSLPSSIGKCADLLLFDAAENVITGSIPTELGMLKKLEELVLNGNSELSGSIPSELGLLNGTLVEFNIRGTSIAGTLPPSLCNIPALKFDCSPSLCGCSACPCSDYNIST